jgi:hypothetical protein
MAQMRGGTGQSGKDCEKIKEKVGFAALTVENRSRRARKRVGQKIIPLPRQHDRLPYGE